MNQTRQFRKKTPEKPILAITNGSNGQATFTRNSCANQIDTQILMIWKNRQHQHRYRENTRQAPQQITHFLTWIAYLKHLVIHIPSARTQLIDLPIHSVSFEVAPLLKSSPFSTNITHHAETHYPTHTSATAHMNSSCSTWLTPASVQFTEMSVKMHKNMQELNMLIDTFKAGIQKEMHSNLSGHFNAKEKTGKMYTFSQAPLLNALSPHKR